VPDLVIVIVSYNVRDLLRACLVSIARSDPSPRLETWVVDNCSRDGTVEMVQTEFPWVRLVTLDQNLGYARANNIALRALLEREGTSGLPRYVLLLNPDTELTPTALADMVAFLDAHPEAGVVGPKLIRGDGSLDLACRRSFPTPLVSLYRLTGLSRLFPRSRRFGRYNLTYLDPDVVAEVDAVAGACMMVRGEILRTVGLLDEAFFMYGEDLDWALRIKQAGWKVYYDGRTVVRHYKRASSRQRSVQSLVAFYQAMLIFFRKHYARQTAWPIRWLIVAAIYLRGMLAIALSQIPSKVPGRTAAAR